MTIETWLLFSSIALAATLSPGPAVLLVTSHSLRYGPKQSIYTILGNISGLFIMSSCSVLGLSTLLLYSTAAFSIIKIAGALYLVWLGIKLWRNGITTDTGRHREKEKGDRAGLYGQGLLIALTNPKALAFTTALFPQFILTASPLTMQFFILVSTFMAFSFVCLLGYAVASHTMNRRTKPFISGKLPGRIFGGVFILSGAALAASGNK